MDATDHEQRMAANRARMRPAPAPPPPADDGSLRPAVCPRCEYDLTGSPPAGTCPECGRKYGTGTVYLYGSPRDRGPPTAGQLWAQGAAHAMVLIFWFVTGRLPGAVVILWAGWPSFGSIGFIAALWRKATGTEMTAIRVAIGPAGVRQVRRSLGPVPFARADRVKSISWSDVRSASLTPSDVGRVSVSITPYVAIWWRYRTHIVNALVTCTPEQLPALQSRIAHWRAKAAGLQSGDTGDADHAR